MGGANPTSQAGWDDAVDPATAIGKQGYKRISHLAGKFANDMVNQKASGGGNTAPIADQIYLKRPPNPLNFARLGGATAAGIAAESTTQNALNATRGGEYSENPYLASLEKLGSRAVGGATTGAIYGKSLPGAIIGTVGGVGYNILEDAATLVPMAFELYDLHLQNQETKKLEERLRSRRPNQ